MTLYTNDGGSDDIGTQLVSSTDSLIVSGSFLKYKKTSLGWERSLFVNDILINHVSIDSSDITAPFQFISYVNQLAPTTNTKNPQTQCFGLVREPDSIITRVLYQGGIYPPPPEFQNQNTGAWLPPYSQDPQNGTFYEEITTPVPRNNDFGYQEVPADLSNVSELYFSIDITTETTTTVENTEIIYTVTTDVDLESTLESGTQEYYKPAKVDNLSASGGIRPLIGDGEFKNNMLPKNLSDPAGLVELGQIQTSSNLPSEALRNTQINCENAVVNYVRNSEDLLGTPSDGETFTGSKIPINWFDKNLDTNPRFQYNKNYLIDSEAGRGGKSFWGNGGRAHSTVTWDYATDEISTLSALENYSNFTDAPVTSYGAGGAAGYAGGRGSSQVGYRYTSGGYAAPTAYLGDFTITPGDKIMVKVPVGGQPHYNIYNDKNHHTETSNETYRNYISYGGRGGQGMIQFFGVRGHPYSKLEKPGIVVLDENKNIIYQITADNIYSNEGESFGNGFRPGSGDSIKIFLPGSLTSDENTSDDFSRRYYISYTARMAKNGDDSPMKAIVSSPGANITLTDASDPAIITEIGSDITDSIRSRSFNESFPIIMPENDPISSVPNNVIITKTSNIINPADYEPIVNPVPCSISFRFKLQYSSVGNIDETEYMENMSYVELEKIADSNQNIGPDIITIRGDSPNDLANFVSPTYVIGESEIYRLKFINNSTGGRKVKQIGSSRVNPEGLFKAVIAVGIHYDSTTTLTNTQEYTLSSDPVGKFYLFENETRFTCEYSGTSFGTSYLYTAPVVHTTDTANSSDDDDDGITYGISANGNIGVHDGIGLGNDMSFHEAVQTRDDIFGYENETWGSDESGDDDHGEASGQGNPVSDFFRDIFGL